MPHLWTNLPPVEPIKGAKNEPKMETLKTESVSEVTKSVESDVEFGQIQPLLVRGEVLCVLCRRRATAVYFSKHVMVCVPRSQEAWICVSCFQEEAIETILWKRNAALCKKRGEILKYIRFFFSLFLFFFSFAMLNGPIFF